MDNKREFQDTLSNILSFWLAASVALFGSMWLMFALSIAVQTAIINLSGLDGHFKEIFYGAILFAAWSCQPMITGQVPVDLVKNKIKSFFADAKHVLNSFL